ncbi:hypothetical protein G7Y89_g10925 [Cudoniella acicularis]|uniref:Protein HRI1 n=1 Tax=Cudoniella acicularis TaxID=354080 RepID=A0A8H4REM4_9HELO|nr:hypothetical protein G7Y89_g10925 [Cudoniella acicularis]
MASKPFVSVRKWIKWGDGPAGENTDTLVLTSASKHFVDTRIYLPTAPFSLSLPTSTPLPPSRLEWGFAGTASSTPAAHNAQTGELETPAHTVWTHWVDNKTRGFEEVRDEGDMWTRDDGKGGEEVLEKGVMVNPNTGKVEAYEELWVDLEPILVDGESRYWSWVLRTESESVRGVLIRIGEYIQGVVRKGDYTSVSRWKWFGESEWGVPIGRWRVEACVGALEVPAEAFDIRSADESKSLRPAPKHSIRSFPVFRFGFNQFNSSCEARVEEYPNKKEKRESAFAARLFMALAWLPREITCTVCTVYITSNVDPKYVVVPKAPKSGSTVVVQTLNNKSEQQWYIKDGNTTIISVDTKLCLDGGAKSNWKDMGNLYIKECADTEDAQKFNVLADGRIELAANPKECIDLQYMKATANNPVGLYACAGLNNVGAADKGINWPLVNVTTF